jgi:protein-tyrosine phosphatase
MMHKFAPASEDERIVFGAAKPGYGDEQVEQWVWFMQEHGIRQVCCLLPQAEMVSYGDLLGAYGVAFGDNRVCWAPLEDFQLADRQVLMGQILPFLEAANELGERVVVHCAGGIGRTGQVLAAWLVRRRGFAVQEAIASVRRMGRNPNEAVAVALFRGRNPWKVAEDLKGLLEDCRSVENEG